MLSASALPMTSLGCCNQAMFQGKELGDAIREAMVKKAELLRDSHVKVTQGTLAAALGVRQPSISEMLNTGRIAKGRLPKLLDYFSDVVGPDHFGLPLTKFEMDFLRQLRRLPVKAQTSLLDQVTRAADAADAAISEISVSDRGASAEKQQVLVA